MKRTIEISTRGTRLYVSDFRLVIEQEREVLARIPVEDIAVIVLDSTGVELSSGALKALAIQGAALLSCDDRHHPNGMFLPLASNSLHAERIRHQVEASEPLRKNLWTRIIAAKIRNQALALGEKYNDLRLGKLASRIRSGDPENIEAQAGRLYWARFFQGCPGIENGVFRRRQVGEFLNSHLNYGYAVLRAATARALCAAGLHPGLGIHHHNRYSGYCLADDLMEPFRPWIDVVVRHLAMTGARKLEKQSKSAILAVLTATCTFHGGTGPLLVALERSAATLARAFAAASKGMSAPKAARQLLLPSIPRNIKH